MIVSNLPRHSTPFIGRTEEVAEIVRLLDNPACQLLTLVGPGGIGKTRLAIEVARRVAPTSFENGVHFVALQALNSPDFMVSALADGVDFRFNPGGDPKQQLLDYFRDKTLLMLIDNFEHLMEGVEVVVEILNAAPDVRILVTSRERLNLVEEWVFDVRELKYPANEAETDIEGYDAVQLFVQHARRTHVSFTLTSSQKPSVIRICRLVGGMPLGIELAAVRTRALPCAEIAEEIGQSLDILETPARNVEPRHRNIRAAFEPMWDRLTDEQQTVFKKLSVFRGGFTREAAEQIAGASLAVLSALVDKSLVRLDDEGRYDMHELLRQYAEERLDEVTHEAAQIHNRHCSYYMRFMESQWPHLTSSTIKAAVHEINVELENVRTAWEWAVTHYKAREIEAALNTLWYFFDIEARAQEGVRMFGKAADALKADEGLWAKLTARHGAQYYQMVAIERSEALLRESIAVLRRVGASADLAFALNRVWFVSGKNVGYIKGIVFLKESLALYTEVGSKWGMGQALWLLVYAYIEQGIEQGNSEALEQAYQYGKSCLAIYQELNSPYGLAIAYLSLGNATYWLGEYSHACEYYQKSLSYFQDVGIHWGIPYALRGLGDSMCSMGKYIDAGQAALQALQYVYVYQQMGTGVHAISHLCVVAECWLGEGQTERAYELLALLNKRCQELGFTRNRNYLHALFRLDENLLPNLAAAAERGRARNFDSAVQKVMQELVQLAESTLVPQASIMSEVEILHPNSFTTLLAEPLSERELEVLRLVAEGFTNHEIANQLYVGVSTVKKHINHIYDKLDVKNRTQAVARARAYKILP